MRPLQTFVTVLVFVTFAFTDLHKHLINNKSPIAHVIDKLVELNPGGWGRGVPAGGEALAALGALAEGRRRPLGRAAGRARGRQVP
jgi:hypothetical protein